MVTRFGVQRLDDDSPRITQLRPPAVRLQPIVNRETADEMPRLVFNTPPASLGSTAMARIRAKRDAEATPASRPLLDALQLELQDALDAAVKAESEARREWHDAEVDGYGVVSIRFAGYRAAEGRVAGLRAALAIVQMDGAGS